MAKAAKKSAKEASGLFHNIMKASVTVPKKEVNKKQRSDSSKESNK